MSNRQRSTPKNAPCRGVFFGYVRIATALAASLAIHLCALTLGSIEFSDAFKGPPQNKLFSGLKAEMLVTLTLPLRSISQQPTTLGPSEADSGNAVASTDPGANLSTVSDKQASMATVSQKPGNTPVHYFERHELDRAPRIVDNLDAKGGPLEKALAEFDVRGSIIMECWISDKGSVDRLTIVSSTLPDGVSTIIVRHALLASFVPARLNHEAVPSRILIELALREKHEN